MDTEQKKVDAHINATIEAAKAGIQAGAAGLHRKDASAQIAAVVLHDLLFQLSTDPNIRGSLAGEIRKECRVLRTFMLVLMEQIPRGFRHQP